MNTRMKRTIQRILHRFGYQLNRTENSQIDAFEAQRQLISVKQPVIFDIGAHTGEIARIYRERFPLALIHCFEPFPQSFHLLLENVKGDARTFCHMAAVSAERGTAVLSANTSSATNSLLMTDERGSEYWGKGTLDPKSQVDVDTTTVDAFCLESGVSNIDILKMDAQGAEFSILEGARDMLANQRISLVFTELLMCPTYKGQHKLHEYLSLLDSFGYDLLDFFNPVRLHNRLIQADAVFLSPSFKKRNGHS